MLKSKQDQEIFLQAILNPPPPNERLKKAKKKYLKFLKTNKNGKDTQQ